MKKQSTYSDLLKDPRWQKKRDEIINRDSHRCRLCGRIEDLEVHHILYEENTDPWDYDENYLITVCEFCHNRIHSQLAENSHLKERCRFLEDDLVYRTMRYLTTSYPKFIYDFNQLSEFKKGRIMWKLIHLINELLNEEEDNKKPAFYK
jgi:hypothetical protein